MLTIERNVIADALRWFAAWPKCEERDSAEERDARTMLPIIPGGGLGSEGAQRLVRLQFAKPIDDLPGWIHLTPAGVAERDRLFPDPRIVPPPRKPAPARTPRRDRGPRPTGARS